MARKFLGRKTEMLLYMFIVLKYIGHMYIVSSIKGIEASWE